MRVAMEQAVLEQLLHIAVDETARAGLTFGDGDGVDAHSAAKMLHHHGGRAQAVDHVGNVDVGRSAPCIGEAPHVPRLAREVHLEAQVAGDLVDDRHETPAPQRRKQCLRHGGDQAQDAHVRLDRLGSPGPAHLDDDLATVGQRGTVDLRHRRRGEWRHVEAGEQLRGGVPERGLDGLHRLLRRKRADMVLEACQGVLRRLRQQVGPQAQVLAELDEGSAQSLQQGREAFGHGMVVAAHHAAVPAPPHDEAGKGQADLQRAPGQGAMLRRPGGNRFGLDHVRPPSVAVGRTATPRCCRPFRSGCARPPRGC